MGEAFFKNEQNKEVLATQRSSYMKFMHSIEPTSSARCL
jgi:hypothetical protein